MNKFQAEKEGFLHPVEWAKQESTWLSWPQNKETWEEEELENAQHEFADFIAAITQDQKVNLLVHHEEMKQEALEKLAKTNFNPEKLNFHFIKTNDSWLRDCGPDFLINKEKKQKLILNWEYNAWGEKYPPFDHDNAIPLQLAISLGLDSITTDFVLEGGSVEFNEFGDLLTTKSCLLNVNRNPFYDQDIIEEVLKKYFGVQRVIWLEAGIEGDDTDGHIDDFARFVPGKKILLAQSNDVNSEDYKILSAARKILEAYNEFEIIDLPMPDKVFMGELQIPASYANYCITNNQVLVPVFGKDQDEMALQIIQSCFPNKKVVGLASNWLTIGLGSFHCLSKQEPAL